MSYLVQAFESVKTVFDWDKLVVQANGKPSKMSDHSEKIKWMIMFSLILWSSYAQY